jgi:hypothetical protein
MWSSPKCFIVVAMLSAFAIVDANVARAQYIAGWGPYYQPQFQYTPPTFMSSQPTGVPWYAHTPTLAESEAAQNAAAIDQSAQVFLGIDDSDKQSEQKYRSTFPPKPLVTPQSTRAVASAAAPHRLTTSQYDRTHRIITWPLELRDPKFDDVRFQLDKLFHERSPQNSGEGSDNAKAIAQACNQMEEILKTDIRVLRPMQYIQVMQFIHSLAYEARFAERS